MWIDFLLGYLPGEACKDNTQFNQNEYVGALGQLYVTIHDLKQAITAFLASINREESRRFLMFDGHVSDCGCHLRASMSMSIIQYFSANPQELTSLVDLVNICETGLANTKELMRSLCLESASNRGPKFPKTTNDLLLFVKAIKWQSESKQVREIKYLFYCYVLSQYKSINARKDQDSVQIDIDQCFKAKNDLICNFSCQGNGKLGKGCRYLKHARVGKATLKQWTLVYQARLSKMSVSYLKEFDSVSDDLVRESYRESHKKVAAIPSFLQFQILEKIWARKRFPFLFCLRVLHGVHSTDVYAKASVGPNFNWILKPVSLEEVEESPHIIITGFSQVLDHLTSLPDIDFAQLIHGAQEQLRGFWYTFMSKHKQYPFETDLNEECNMQTVLSEKSYIQYLQYKNNHHQIFKIMDFNPKHIFVEFPSVVFREQSILSGKKGVLFV